MKEKFPESFAGKLVLDIGSLDINGSNRDLFSDCLYLGVDIAPGPNVDIVSIGHELALPDETFDTIISTECFEHDRYYPQTLKNIVRMLKPGGLFLFSCATTGRPEHGTRRSEPTSAPLLGKFGDWSDYYKNLTEQDFREVLEVDKQFSKHQFIVNESSHDLYFCGIKTGQAEIRNDYSFLDHSYSAQLYVDAGAGFSEDHSALLPLPSGAFAGQPHELRFDLQGYEGLKALRLDPLNVAALIGIEKLALVANGAEINLLPGIRTNASAKDSGLYCFKSDDPQIVLDAIDTKSPGQPQTLIARVRYASIGQVAALFSEVVETRSALAEANATLQLARTELATGHSARAQIEATLTLTQTELLQAKAAQRATQAELDTEQADLRKSKSATGDAMTKLGVAQVELRRVRFSIDEARSDLRWKEDELEHAREALTSVRSELARARADQERTASALNEALTHKSALDTVQASRSWRLTSPLRRLKRELNDRVRSFRPTPSTPVDALKPAPQPSRNRHSFGDISFQLVPVNQLSFNASDPKPWQAFGDDPVFLLEFDGDLEGVHGWHRAELRIDTDQKVSIAQFFFDTGKGFNEVETLGLAYAPGEQMERILLIDKPIKALRFDPIAEVGKFGIEHLRVTALSEKEALFSMASRVAKHHKDYGDQDPEAALATVAVHARARKQAMPRLLLELYADTFNLRRPTIQYSSWIETIEQPALPTDEEVAAQIALLSDRPLISIVMPVYETSEGYLRSCIESVLAQSYPHWELCIADDASPGPEVRRVLEKYCARDPRIRAVYREQNGHISRASNSALALAHGPYVALLDHDDVLATHALFFFACEIDKRPTAQILYSDEDKIDGRGNRFEPHFKSDWNPDLFFSQNYLSHLSIYRRDLLTRVGGFRTGVEGSQDQDLILRCLPHVQNGDIVHIPRVLYHWRAAEGSTASASSAKSYTVDAGIKSLRDYFEGIGTSVRVEAAIVPNTYRVQYALPNPPPLVSLLIPTRDMATLLIQCVRSILERTTYPNYEILILDNGSVEPETLSFFEEIQRNARVKVLRYDHPFNYSSINNFGVTHAKGEIVGLINNDVEVISPEWLTDMTSHACRREIGCVGAKLYYSNDTVQHGGVILGLGGVACHSHKHFDRDHPGYFGRLVCTQNFSAVTAACLLVRKEIYEQVGGLDEKNLAIAFNDVDFCLKVREAGYRNLWTPYAELYHYESISRGTEDNPIKLARFNSEIAYMQSRWGKELENDPFYNPNLTRGREDFSI